MTARRKRIAHTPGPWHIDRLPGLARIPGSIFAEDEYGDEGPTIFAFPNIHDISFEELEGNARLAKESTEMLSVCLMLEDLRVADDLLPIVTKAREILSRLREASTSE